MARRRRAYRFARTRSADMALRHAHTKARLHGLTRKPWHTRLTAGGSIGFVLGWTNTPLSHET